jgi:hypothetical protein
MSMLTRIKLAAIPDQLDGVLDRGARTEFRTSPFWRLEECTEY